MEECRVGLPSRVEERRVVLTKRSDCMTNGGMPFHVTFKRTGEIKVLYEGFLESAIVYLLNFVYWEPGLRIGDPFPLLFPPQPEHRARHDRLPDAAEFLRNGLETGWLPSNYVVRSDYARVYRDDLWSFYVHCFQPTARDFLKIQFDKFLHLLPGLSGMPVWMIAELKEHTTRTFDGFNSDLLQGELPRPTTGPLTTVSLADLGCAPTVGQKTWKFKLYYCLVHEVFRMELLKNILVLNYYGKGWAEIAKDDNKLLELFIYHNHLLVEWQQTVDEYNKTVDPCGQRPRIDGAEALYREALLLALKFWPRGGIFGTTKFPK